MAVMGEPHLVVTGAISERVLVDSAGQSHGRTGEHMEQCLCGSEVETDATRGGLGQTWTERCRSTRKILARYAGPYG